MKNIVKLFLFLQLALLQLSGCSIAPHPTADISKNPKAVQMKFKSLADFKRLFPDAKFKHEGENAYTAIFNPAGYQTNIKNINPGDEKEVSVKYYRNFLHKAPNVSVLVEFPNGDKYPAYLDTGFPVSIMLTSDIVLDNKFEILPIKGDTFQGICRIPELKVGKIKVEDALVFYYERQWQLRVLNIPIYSHPNIILGIDFIKTFDYILFDNVNQEVVFSKDKIFSPDNPDSWLSYPFEIKPDSIENNRIMVKIPINGREYELFFDTCGYRPGLHLNQIDWETLSKNVTFKNLHKTYGDSWQAGRVQFQKATVSELSIGEKKLKNVDVNISDESEKLSMFSLGYYQDTVVVLDFVNKLFWIKS